MQHNPRPSGRARRTLILFLASLVAGGCTRVLGHQETDADRNLAEGLEAFDRGDYTAALEHLSWVALNYPEEPIGQRALLALAAADLDPRNPSRRLGVGSELVARYIRESETPPWLRPPAVVLYLLSQELGAAEERAADLEQQRQQERASRVPEYSGTSVPARIRALTEERDRLQKRVTQLEQDLAKKDQELERIRKTLRP